MHKRVHFADFDEIQVCCKIQHSEQLFPTHITAAWSQFPRYSGNAVTTTVTPNSTYNGVRRSSPYGVRIIYFYITLHL